MDTLDTEVLSLQLPAVLSQPAVLLFPDTPLTAPTVYGHWAGYPYLFAAAPSAEADAGVEEARKKREAEPEADPYYFYGHGGYAGYGGLIPTTSGGLVPSGGPLVPGYAAYAAWPYGYAHYGYAAGCRNNAGALVPCA